jgi:hypothetical protein
MKKADAWKAKVAELKTFSEESLTQMEQDKKYLLKLLKDLEDTLEILQRNPWNPKITIMKVSTTGSTLDPLKAGESSVSQVYRGEAVDLQKIFADQREKIPTYRSVISHFEHIGTLLRTSLKRISEAETFVGSQG